MDGTVSRHGGARRPRCVRRTRLDERRRGGVCRILRHRRLERGRDGRGRKGGRRGVRQSGRLGGSAGVFHRRTLRGRTLRSCDEHGLPRPGDGDQRSRRDGCVAGRRVPHARARSGVRFRRPDRLRALLRRPGGDRFRLGRRLVGCHGLDRRFGGRLVPRRLDADARSDRSRGLDARFRDGDRARTRNGPRLLRPRPCHQLVGRRKRFGNGFVLDRQPGDPLSGECDRRRRKRQGFRFSRADVRHAGDCLRRFARDGSKRKDPGIPFLDEPDRKRTVRAHAIHRGRRRGRLRLHDRLDLRHDVRNGRSPRKGDRQTRRPHDPRPARNRDAPSVSASRRLAGNHPLRRRPRRLAHQRRVADHADERRVPARSARTWRDAALRDQSVQHAHGRNGPDDRPAFRRPRRRHLHPPRLRGLDMDRPGRMGDGRRGTPGLSGRPRRGRLRRLPPDFGGVRTLRPLDRDHEADHARLPRRRTARPDPPLLQRQDAVLSAVRRQDGGGRRLSLRDGRWLALVDPPSRTLLRDKPGQDERAPHACERPRPRRARAHSRQRRVEELARPRVQDWGAAGLRPPHVPDDPRHLLLRPLEPVFERSDSRRTPPSA